MSKNDIEKACAELNTTTSVVVAPEASVPVKAQDTGVWDDSADQLDSRDIVLPRILLMQGLSKLVMNGVRRPGDFAESVSGAELPKVLELLPFKMTKHFTVYKKAPGATNWEWDSTLPITKENINLPYTEKIAGGVEIQRQYTYQFFCLRKGEPMPCAICLKSASGGAAGRIIATQMYIVNKRLGLTPASFWIDLSTEKKENDKGIFFEVKTKLGRKSTDDEIKEALFWLDTMAAKTVRIDATEDEAVAEVIPTENLNY